MTHHRTLDQGFKAFGARLATTAGPFDPSTGHGLDTDSARYSARPGIDFFRPWLAIRNGLAYQWPLGVEGFELTTDPVLGVHRFIGDNAVSVDVLHTGEERIVLTGNFPGDTSPAQIQMLREVVRRKAPAGKILFIPEIMTHAQNVQVGPSKFSRPEDGYGRDFRYSIEFLIQGLAGKTGAPQFQPDEIVTNAAAKGKAPRTLKVDSKRNTLRKIAAWKLGSGAKWRQVFNLNELWFVSRSVPLAKAPDYRIPVGTVIYF